MKWHWAALALAGTLAVGCAEQHDVQYSQHHLAVDNDDRTAEAEGEVAKDEEHHYVFEIPEGATWVIIELTGSAAGDADLLAKLNELATQSDYDCGPLLNGSDEVCLFLQDLEDSALNITIRGFALISPYYLTVRWEGIGTSP